MFEIGDTVDRYVIEGVLGQGGLAIVYKVRHKRLLTNHAMKVLFVSRGPITERLVLEGRIQANLRHPNIVHVSDVLDVDGAPVLLMDFVDGPTLKEWLKDNRPSLSQAVFLFTKIIEGMEHAHLHGMIHRDLKPDNIMLAPQPKGWVPKLMDFGLAKLLDAGQSLSNTRAGATMGTPEFMSPEQVRDAADVDERADIFSLGCIFYQLLTGTSPFRCKDIVGTFNAVTKEDPPKPSTLQPTIPESLDALVLHMLAKDRDDRPTSCSSILKTIEQIVPTLDETPSSPPAHSHDPTDLPSGSLKTPFPDTSAISGAIAGAATASEPTTGSSGRPRSIPPPWAGALPADVDDPGSLTFCMPGESDLPETIKKPEDGGTLSTDWPPASQSKKREWTIGLTVVGGLLAALYWGTSPSTNHTPTDKPERTALGPSAKSKTEVPVNDAPEKAQQATPQEASEAAQEVPAPRKRASTPPPAPTRAAPATASAKKAAAPKPTTAKVALTGDARTVWLTNDAGMFPIPGNVPPGQYQIKAWFSSATPVMAGTKAISGTQNVTVNCNSFMERCK